MKLRILALAALFFAAAALSWAVYSTYLSLPESVPSGTTYYIYGETQVDIYNGYTYLTLYKDGSYYTDTWDWGYYRVYLSTSETDYGSKTVQWDLYAEDGYWNETATAYINIYLPAQPPTGVFDSVSASVQSGQNLNANGWAADFEMGAPVSHVDYYIDQSYAGQASLNSSRPDVESAKATWGGVWIYCTQNLTNSGWNITHNTSSLGAGSHSIRVVAYDNQGLSCDLGTKTFSVSTSVTFGLSATSFTYTGGTQGPSVVATPGGATFTTGGTLSATNAGTYMATATATGGYTGSNSALTWTIAKANQAITFNNPGSQTGSSCMLTASASSGLSIAYAVSGPATLSGNTLMFTSSGTVTVTASQGGGDNFNAATPVVVSFSVTLDPNVDQDQDGIPTSAETLLGTDPQGATSQDSSNQANLKVHQL